MLITVTRLENKERPNGMWWQVSGKPELNDTGNSADVTKCLHTVWLNRRDLKCYHS